MAKEFKIYYQKQRLPGVATPWTTRLARSCSDKEGRLRLFAHTARGRRRSCTIFGCS